MTGLVEPVANVTPGMVPVTCSMAQPDGGVAPEPVSKLSETRGVVCAAQGGMKKTTDDTNIISHAGMNIKGFMENMLVSQR